MTVVRPDGDVLEKVHSARLQFRAGDPLPTWSEMEWVAATTVQLGKCGVHAGYINGLAQTVHGTAKEIEDERELLREQVIGVVGIVFDFLEDIDRRLDGDPDRLVQARHEALGQMVKIMRQEGFGVDEMLDAFAHELPDEEVKRWAKMLPETPANE